VLIPTSLKHSNQSPHLVNRSPAAAVGAFPAASPHPTLVLNRPRNFLTVHKNGRDSTLVSIVLREKTVITRDGGSGATPPTAIYAQHLEPHNTTPTQVEHLSRLHPSSAGVTGSTGCPFAHAHTLSESGGAPVERSLVLAILTPIERDLEAMATIDDRGVVRSCNSSFLTLFGYSQDEMIGRSIGSLMSEVALPVLRAIAKEKTMTDDQRRVIGKVGVTFFPSRSYSSSSIFILPHSSSPSSPPSHQFSSFVLKGFHAALGLHRDFTVFPMKFAVDELYHHATAASLSHASTSSSAVSSTSPGSSPMDLRVIGNDGGEEEGAHAPQHTFSVLPPSILYQCTIQRLRPEEEQDLVSMLAETYEDLKWGSSLPLSSFSSLFSLLLLSETNTPCPDRNLKKANP
jgi:PAS domain-containing protein